MVQITSKDFGSSCNHTTAEDDEDDFYSLAPHCHLKGTYASDFKPVSMQAIIERILPRLGEKQTHLSV